MTTARDLIQEALEQIGVYAPGERVGAANAARALSVLNQMLDSWSNESLACYAISEQTLTLVPGQAAYTVGPGGDLNGPRPLSLITTTGSAYILDGNGSQYPVTVIAMDRWNQRGSRNTTSNFPDVLFYDPQFPLGVLNLDPIPTIDYVLHFDSYAPLAEFASLDSAVSFPPGYQLAIRSNLAEELRAFFPSAAIDPVALQKAAEAKAAIKRTNKRQTIASYDPGMAGISRGRYSIYTDSTRR